MSRDFSRTLQTADDAASIARLLDRAAKAALYPDRPRLAMLAQRYRDYSAALRETVAAVEPVEVHEDQGALAL